MNAVETALYTALNGEAAITALLASATSIFNQLAPQGSSYDMVVFAQASGVEENETPTRSRDLVYMIKGVSDTGFLAAGGIDTQIDTLLHDSALTVTGYTNFWLARESDLRFLETTAEGENYYHAGALYRFRITQ